MIKKIISVSLSIILAGGIMTSCGTTNKLDTSKSSSLKANSSSEVSSMADSSKIEKTVDSKLVGGWETFIVYDEGKPYIQMYDNYEVYKILCFELKEDGTAVAVSKDNASNATWGMDSEGNLIIEYTDGTIDKYKYVTEYDVIEQGTEDTHLIRMKRMEEEEDVSSIPLQQDNGVGGQSDFNFDD